MRYPSASSTPPIAIKCHACRLGKSVRTPDGTHLDTIRKEKDGGLKKDITRFGSKVATDQFVSRVKGRQFETRGKEADGQKFAGGTIFVDLSSGYVEVHPQVSLNVAETIASNRRFERMLNIHGPDVHHYLGDNGVYKAKEFQEELKKRGQTMEFCGVGAHHQNGVAKRAIRTVSEAARTMMLHASIHWHGTAYLYNLMPRANTGVAPIEILTGTRMSGEEIRKSRVWGCPAYILGPKIQDGNKLPRWVPRARRGQFMGRSKVHASNVGQIRDLNTGNITTQFHVTYDDFFSTVASKNENIALDNTWTHLFQFTSEDVRDPNGVDDMPELSDEWLTPDELEDRRRTAPRRIHRVGLEERDEQRQNLNQNVDREEERIEFDENVQDNPQMNDETEIDINRRRKQGSRGSSKKSNQSLEGD